MDDSYQNNTKVFLDWLNHIGVQLSPKAQLTADHRGRCLVASGDFDEDELIFSVPRTSTFNVKDTIAEFCTTNPRISAETVSAMPPWAVLTLLMMSDMSHNSSKWSSYWNVLPAKLDSLVFWNEQELAELQASAVLSKIGKVHAEEVFHKSISKLLPGHSNIDFFHRIASIIMAYAFDIPEESNEEDDKDDTEELVDDEDEKTYLAMVPLADMLNADADNNARLHCDGQDLEMRAIQPIKAGEEILNDYGQLPRSDLLRRYGYVTDKYAEFDVVEIATDFILEVWQDFIPAGECSRLTDNEVVTRVELAKRDGVFEESYDVARPNADSQGIPDELVALIFLLVANDETLSTIQSSDLPSRSKMETELVGKILAQILQRREKQYATTVEEDEEILKSGNCSPRQHMAVKVRRGEKTVLRQAVQEANTYQASNKRMRAGNAKRGREEENQDQGKRNKRR